jgi:GNAT superfamily N-acetyltransferase
MITVRSATEEDLAVIGEMIEDHVQGHPASAYPRSPARLREAYFGPRPVGRLVVACRDDRVVGMAQWTRLFDNFWSVFGAELEWFYVRPDSRGLGIPAAIVAEVCRLARDEQCEFLKGAAEAEEAGALYEKVAIGWPLRQVYLSAEAFQVCADLAGRPAREIVRGLPDPGLNRTAARPRKMGAGGSP